MNLQIFKAYSQQGLYRAIDVFNAYTEYTNTQKVMGYRFLFKFRHMEPRMCPTKQQIIDKVWGIIKNLNMFDEENQDENVDESINNPNNKTQRIAKKYRKYKSQDDKFKDENIAQELVDILLEFEPAEGEKLLKMLRDSKMVANNDGVRVDGPQGTIYSDSQSVHKIRNRAVEISIQLCKDYPYPRPMGSPEQISEIIKLRAMLTDQARDAVLNYAKKQIGSEHSSRGATGGCFIQKQAQIQMKQPSIIFPSFETIEKKINDLVERYGYDNAEYGENFLEDIFISLWMYISGHKYKNELIQRLYEEMIEMYNYCSSGLLSHLINVIQGYTDDPRYILTISIEDQCKGVIYNYLDKIIQDNYDNDDYPFITSAIDNGIKNITPVEKEQYIKFVRERVNLKTKEWKVEYGNDFISHVNPLVSKYLTLSKDEL